MNYCIDIYKNFKCQAGNCADTCCYGWEILVDDETLEKYKREPGPLGRKLRRTVSPFGNAVIRKKVNGRCPFENHDGLCQLQADGREMYMPKVCREYPRRILDFSGRQEITLEMACPEVARMILSKPERLFFVECDEDRKTLWTLGNDAPEFRDALLYMREKLIDLVWMDISLLDMMESVYSFGYEMHHELSMHDIKGLLAVESKINTSENTLLMGLDIIDKLITYNMEDFRLSYSVPRLYRRIKSYHKIFDKLELDEANKLFEDTFGQMIKDGIVSYDKYRAYLSFTLQQLFLTAYEHYYLLNPIALSLAYTQILMVMDVCAYISEGKDYMTLENQVLELSSLERRMRHNVSVKEGMFERIRADFIEKRVNITSFDAK